MSGVEILGGITLDGLCVRSMYSSILLLMHQTHVTVRGFEHHPEHMGSFAKNDEKVEGSRRLMVYQVGFS